MSTTIYNNDISNYLNLLKTQSSKENSLKIEELINAIDLSSVKIYPLKTTEKLLVVDLKSLNGFESSNKIKAIFYVYENKISHSNIVSFDNKVPFEHLDRVLLSILNNDKDKLNYSGKISFYNMHQRIMLMDEFENGDLISNGIARNKVKRSKTGKSKICIEWYWIISIDGFIASEIYITTTCDNGGGEDCLDSRTKGCGGSDGSGSGASSSSNPTPPSNPVDKQVWDYIDESGEFIRKIYNEANNTWAVAVVNLNNVVVMNNPIKYNFLIFQWPINNQKVSYESMLYTYHGASASWVGVPETDAVIVDPTLKNNPCLIGVYEKLGGASTFQSYLKNFDGNFSVANLKLSAGVDPNHPNASASTFEPIDYLIEIRLNPNFLNSPQLNIARTFIHEMIHAEIYRQLLSVAGEPNIPWSATFINSVKDDFPTLEDYYTRFKYNVPAGQQPSDAQHELMADHYREVIIQAMKEFDPTQTTETYSALSWIGLMGSGNIDNTTGLPSKPTVAWKAIPQTTRLQILNVYYNFKISNPPCQ